MNFFPFFPKIGMPRLVEGKNSVENAINPGRHAATAEAALLRRQSTRYQKESSEIISLTVPSTYIILIHVPKFFFLFLSKTCEPPRHYISRECGAVFFRI